MALHGKAPAMHGNSGLLCLHAGSPYMLCVLFEWERYAGDGKLALCGTLFVAPALIMFLTCYHEPCQAAILLSSNLQVAHQAARSALL